MNLPEKSPISGNPSPAVGTATLTRGPGTISTHQPGRKGCPPKPVNTRRRQPCGSSVKPSHIFAGPGSRTSSAPFREEKPGRDILSPSPYLTIPTAQDLRHTPMMTTFGPYNTKRVNSQIPLRTTHTDSRMKPTAALQAHHTVGTVYPSSGSPIIILSSSHTQMTDVRRNW